MKRILFCLWFTSIAFSEIPVEMEGMEAGILGAGTYLTTGPTFTYDRPAKQGGLHSQSEEWTPEKTRYRMLINRLVPGSWEIAPPSLWLSTGNEIGDMMYQAVLSDTKEVNRTPMMEAGFRTPSFKGFWGTARGVQVDHYSTKTLRLREHWVGGMDYALFGENLPFLSSGYAGLGYTGVFQASLLAGTEYSWVLGESGRWIPVHSLPRVEMRFDYRLFQLTLNYEKLHYENQSLKEKGIRDDWSGTLRIACDEKCKQSQAQLGAGIQFRTVNDSGETYFGLRDDRAVWPFVELILRPTEQLVAAGFAGINENDWMVKDSIELHFKPLEPLKSIFGIKNHLGTTLNPLGDSYEFYGNDTLKLFASDYMQLHRLYLDISQTSSLLDLGIHVAGWVQKGAETFDTVAVEKTTADFWTRVGNVSRIDSWIRGFSAEAHAKLFYQKMFSLGSRFGFEYIDGPQERFEVEPVEKWVQIDASWIFREVFYVDHSWIYRSDASWNLRTPEPFVVKGGWFWNASFSQHFPEWNFYLTGTILHALTNERIQVPGGGNDRTRFFCGIRKMF